MVERGAEPWPAAAFSQRSGTVGDDCAHSLSELSREQSTVLPSFSRVPVRCPRDDAQSARNPARSRARSRAPSGTGVGRYGQYRSMAGRPDAPAALGGFRARAAAPSPQLWSLICPIAELAKPRAEPSRPTISHAVPCVRAGSIEAIRLPSRSTADLCPIRCQTPEQHGRTKTTKLRIER